jgi:uncharacterized protein (TIGR03000 family)
MHASHQGDFIMNRSNLISAVLGLAALFTIAGLADAAPRGGGGGYRGGGYGYGGRGYGYGGGYYHGGYWYGGGIGIGIGVYPYGYGYPYAYPPVVVGGYAPPTVVVQGQPAVDTPPPLPAGETAPKNAQIKVLVSDPNAKVWFDGNPTTSTGAERLFHTPDLTPGATNTYRIRAAWMVNGKQVTQEQVVPVQSGRGSVADFTRPMSEGIAPPPLPK